MDKDRQKIFGYYFGCAPQVFSGAVILTPFIPAERFKKYCDVLETFRGALYAGIIAERDGVRFAVVRCGIGDRLLGEAALLLGRTRVDGLLFAGSCGGLKGCSIGDLIVCEGAFNGEGFTRYHSESFDIGRVMDSGEVISADIGYTERLKKVLSDRPGKAGFGTGRVFTIGSIMAEERKEDILAVSKKGFRAVEMELSAFFRAARVTGTKAAGLVFVSDLPLEKPFWEGLSSADREKYDKGIEDLVRISVKFAGEVI